MTRHYPDLGSASDWLKICFNQSETLPRSEQEWYQVISMEFQTFLYNVISRRNQIWRREVSVVFSGYFSGDTHADFNVPTRSGLFHVTEDSFVSLVKQLNNKNKVCKPWCLLLLFVALSLLSQSWFRGLPNDNGNSIENVKKAKGLYKQKTTL